jgi:N-glycosylase/DNA lyase
MGQRRRGKEDAASAPGSADRGEFAIIDLRRTPFDLERTLTSGQVFHWRRHQSGWLAAVGDGPLYVEQSGERLLTPSTSEKLARHYFALDHPLEEICATFPNDPAMLVAAEFCRGLRIVRQPLWECIATFITSAMKQVPHIAQISHRLRESYGTRLEWAGTALFTYPSPERIAALSEADLRACRLGFRAKNLLRAAQLIASGTVDLQTISTLPDAEAHAELCRLPGVGAKVANCVLLFGLERLRAFPIDVWIERVLRRIYFPRQRIVTVRHLQDFSKTHFGAFSGYAQQYLFHHARLTRKPERS